MFPPSRRVPVLFGGAVFSGLLDEVPNAAFAVSTRRLRRGYTGSLLRLRRDSDDAESDFGYLPSGALNTAAITTWLGGATGYCVTWYDQSGNGRDFTQATTARQPQYQASGINSLPDLLFAGTTQWLTCANSISTAQVGTVMGVYKLTAINQDYQYLWTSGDNAANTIVGGGVYYNNGLKRATLLHRQAGSSDEVRGHTDIAAATVYATWWKSDGSDFFIRMNGADETLTVLNGTNSGDWLGDATNRDNFVIGGYEFNSTATGVLKGEAAEVVMWDRVLS